MSCVYFPHVGPFLVPELTLPAAGSGKGIPSRGVVDPDVSQTTSLIGARLHMSVDDEMDDLFHPFPRSALPWDAVQLRRLPQFVIMGMIDHWLDLLRDELEKSRKFFW